VVRGLKLLALNWRLSLIELVPALWVWLAMWDLRSTPLRAAPIQHVTPGQVLIGLTLTIGASVAACWFSRVFGFAISRPRPAIGMAMRDARPFLRRVVVAGTLDARVPRAAAERRLRLIRPHVRRRAWCSDRFLPG
jgi:hypothetical protein